MSGEAAKALLRPNRSPAVRNVLVALGLYNKRNSALDSNMFDTPILFPIRNWTSVWTLIFPGLLRSRRSA